MRIAFLTPEFVTEANFDGGLANYLGRVTTSLVQRGHQVEVFVNSTSETQLEYQGIIVHRLRSGRLLDFMAKANLFLNQRKLPNFFLTISIFKDSLSLNYALRKRSKQIHFDIVQAASVSGAGLFANRTPVAPVVVRVSSYARLFTQMYGWTHTMDRKIHDRLEMSAIRNSNWRYAPSQFIAKLFKDDENIDVTVIESPFHLDNIQFDPGLSEAQADFEPYALHYGTLGQLKGSGLLAKALPSILNVLPDFHLILAGKVEGEVGSDLIELAKAYPGRIRYLGVLPPAQLYPIVHKARIVILPSLVDNLPNTCLESMAFGRAMVASENASFEQLIQDGKSGFLAKHGDSTDLEMTIQKVWCLSEAELAKIGKAAQDRINQMRPEVTVAKLEDYYRAVIEDSRRRIK
ncbi:MAG TPA: glycosyltransferase family 4 protein [Anaerolineaceae bacterium]|nr:glycosyltransferase family 4 protein [Anaerolineaceae bacterium]